jgi:hypothetical protein
MGFIEVLKENNEDKLKDWLSSYGKKPKPVSPIYFFFDLPEEDKIKEESLYGIQVKERSNYNYEYS